MKNTLKKTQTIIAGILCVATLGIATMGPAKADGAASTRNIILGIGALVAGAAIESNVAHKNAAANTVTGDTSNGAAVYSDGHVVMPNGQSYYPGNYGQSVACNSGNCTITGGASNAPYASSYNNYGPYSYNGYNSRSRRF
jgi:hypothetical protein